MTFFLQDRIYLHDRHRLSHQQIDKWLVEDSGKEFLQEKLKQLDAVKTFLWVTDLIRNEGIQFVSLKGPLLSYRIYKDPAVRISNDIDILVEVVAIERITEVLKENGYSFSEGYEWPRKEIQRELIINAYHHISFYNKETGSCVEIHWALMNNLPVTVSKMKNIVSQNLTEIDFVGRKFTVLNKEMELLFLLIHGSRHGWSRLKWLVDIKDYPLDDFDADVFDELSSKLKARRIIGQTNFFLKNFFHKQLPFPGDSRLADFFIQFAQKSIEGDIRKEQSTKDLVRMYRYHWIMFSGFYYRFKLVSSALYRPAEISAIDSSYKISYLLYRLYSFIKRRVINIR